MADKADRVSAIIKNYGPTFPPSFIVCKRYLGGLNEEEEGYRR